MARATLSDVGSKNSGRKSLDDKRNAKSREYVEGVVRDYFDGNVSKAATAFNVSQPTLSDFLNDKAGIGPALADGIANRLGVSLDVVFGRVPPSGDPHPHKTAVMRDPEYLDAPAEVRSAFDSLRGGEGRDDKAISEWLDDLRGLIRSHRLGQLVTHGGAPTEPDD